MERDLKYFVEFTKHPETFSDEEFSKKCDELTEFVKANKDKYNFRTQAWENRKLRLLAEEERRSGIPRAVREEFRELKAELAAVGEEDHRTYIAVCRRWNAFMRKYQALYEFTDEIIADSEEKLKQLIQDYIRLQKATAAAEEARIVAEHSIEEFDEAVAAHYERTGKVPVVFTALKAKKRPDGN